MGGAPAETLGPPGKEGGEGLPRVIAGAGTEGAVFCCCGAVFGACYFVGGDEGRGQEDGEGFEGRIAM